MDADAEMKCIGTGAVECVNIRIGVDTRSVVGGAMPEVVFTSILIVDVVGAIVEGEMECEGAVATHGIER